MKILYVNHYAGSNIHGMEFRPFYLAREWVRAGHEVTLLAASYSHVRTVQPSVNGAVTDEVLDGVRYRWLRTPAYSGNDFGRIRNMLTFLATTTRRAPSLADELRPELVIASSTYPMDIWPCERIARRAGARLVYEVHDLWPLTPMQLGGMSRWHPFIMVVQAAEDHAYRRADKVVSLLPNAAAYMAGRGMAPEKFVYVPNGTDEEEWDGASGLPDDAAELLARLRATGRPILGYAGTHGLANVLDLLLDAAKLLRGRAEVVMIGGGPDRERLWRRVQDEGIDNVSMLPPVPRRSISAFLQSIDIAFMGMAPEPLYRYGIAPNKLIDYMMAGRPVIFSGKAGNDPIAEARCGITTPPGDAPAIAEAMGQLMEMPLERRHAMGQAGREFILRNQTYRVLGQRFLEGVIH